jgi:hypothetical protein
MAHQSEQREYRFTNADLCMFTSNLCNTLTRDLSDLIEFGITAPKIAALKALGDAFEVLPTDEVLLANIIAATKVKLAKMDLVREEIRNMITRCQSKWGAGSWQEKSLGVKGMNRFSEDSLLIAARRTHMQMTVFLPDLADNGLTPAVLDAFEVLNNELEVAKNEQFDKVAEREIATTNRIEKGNELYALDATYCEIGKRVYAKTSPAKYNNYIVYTKASPKKPVEEKTP